MKEVSFLLSFRSASLSDQNGKNIFIRQQLMLHNRFQKNGPRSGNRFNNTSIGRCRGHTSRDVGQRMQNRMRPSSKSPNPITLLASTRTSGLQGKGDNLFQVDLVEFKDWVECRVSSTVQGYLTRPMVQPRKLPYACS